MNLLLPQILSEMFPNSWPRFRVSLILPQIFHTLPNFLTQKNSGCHESWRAPGCAFVCEHDERFLCAKKTRLWLWGCISIEDVMDQRKPRAAVLWVWVISGKKHLIFPLFFWIWCLNSSNFILSGKENEVWVLWIDCLVTYYGWRHEEEGEIFSSLSSNLLCSYVGFGHCNWLLIAVQVRYLSEMFRRLNDAYCWAFLGRLCRRE